MGIAASLHLQEFPKKITNAKAPECCPGSAVNSSGNNGSGVQNEKGGGLVIFLAPWRLLLQMLHHFVRHEKYGGLG